MNELIERMEVEKQACVIINYRYEEFKRHIICVQEFINNEFDYIGTSDFERMHECYLWLNGFLWGLNSIGYIDDVLREKYVQELLDMMTFS